MAEGKPPAVGESTCDAKLTMEGWQRNDPRASQVFSCRVGLAQLQNRLCLVLSRCDTPDARRSALEEIEQGLYAWREAMPAECRPGHEMVPDSPAYVLIASLYLEYFSTVRALYWSSMSCHTTHSNEAQTYQIVDGFRHHSREYTLCLGAARAFVRTLNESEYTSPKSNAAD
jgi:hypothetical protein